MAPPAKRRRRNTLEASEGEGEDGHGRRPKVNTLENFLQTSPPSSPPLSSHAESASHGPQSPARSRTTATTTITTAAPPGALRSSKPSQQKQQTQQQKLDGGPLRQTRKSQSQQQQAGSASRIGSSSSKAKRPSGTHDEGNERQKEGGLGKTASLKSLFSKQAQLASSQRDRKAAAAFDAPECDLISSDDEIAEARPGSSSSLVGQHARKRLRNDSSNKGISHVSGDAHQTTIQSSFGAGQRFLRPPRASPVVYNTREQQQQQQSLPGKGMGGEEEDLRPWSERFGPRSLEELAVHKRKVADVRKWLEDVMGGRLRQRLLVLKGAAGTGKTTTVRLLARNMGCEVLEWRNPAGNAGTGYVSASAQFDEFLNRGRKFGALDLEEPVPSVGSTGFASQSQSLSQSQSQSQSQNQNQIASAGWEKKKMILIEEFPNTFSQASTALASFRQSILQYVMSHTPPPSAALFKQQQPDEPVTPIVLVLSETLLTTTSASADSLTAHRLLGAEILGHPGVGLIEFNVMAPTLLAKALELVVQKESRKSGRRRTPGPLVLKKLGEIGDIRSAISSLEFLCLKGDQDADWGGRVTFTRQKKGVRDAIGLTRGERESLEMVSRREASLGIFHAVGKVVYNKREDKKTAAVGGTSTAAEAATTAETAASMEADAAAAAAAASAASAAAEKMPAFLSHCARPKRSEVSVDALMDETGTDTHTFVSALHENYVLSCESSDPMDLSTSVDYINDCIDNLSLCDLLCPSRDVFFGGRGGGFGADAASQLLRQDEIMFQVAVRGLLYSLPSPVKRQARPSGLQRGGDAFKMFYPTGLKLWRAREEMEGMVDVWTAKLLRGEVSEEPAPEAMSASAGAMMFRRAADPPPSASCPYPPPSSTHTTTQPPPQQEESRNHHLPHHQGDTGARTHVPGLATLGDTARREMLLDRLPYMAHMARGRQTRHLRELEKMVSFRGVAVPPDDEEDENEEEEAAGRGAGVGGARGAGLGEGAWATDKPSEEKSPRRRAGIRAASVASMSAMAQRLVLSDDDIED